MKKKLKISIITVCKNSENLIEETIQSVVDQTIFKSNEVELEYFIIDGESSDNTLNIIKSYAEKYKSISYISEKDDGMYDALIKGFTKVSGDIVAYINAGDFYNLKAFTLVRKIFDKYESVKWLTGEKYLYNEQSDVIRVYTPYNYRAELIQTATYGRFLPFIQQESTFWRRELLNKIDYEKLKKFKYAGDYYMWSCFSKITKLFIIRSYLSGFKYHENQLTYRDSDSKRKYLHETKLFRKNLRFYDFLLIIKDSVFWFCLTIFQNLSFKQHFLYSPYYKTWVLNDLKEKDITYAWVTDFADNTGEGRLAKKYLLSTNKDYLIMTYYNKYFLKDQKIYPKLDQEKILINFSIFKRYILPIIGILVLWYHFLNKRKVAYINYLPLWNSLIILLLPPNTSLGPITGSVYNNEVNNIQSAVRKYILPIFYYVNSKVLSKRNKGKHIFSTDILKNFLNKKVQEKSKFNFVYKNIEILKQGQEKEIDLVIYNRSYFTKNEVFFKEVINKLSKRVDIKFKYFGNLIDGCEDQYMGILPHNEVLDLLKITKFSVCSEENFSSLYTLECIENQVNLFVSQNTKIPFELATSEKIIQINYKKINKSIDIIIEKLKEQKKYDKFDQELFLSAI